MNLVARDNNYFKNKIIKKGEADLFMLKTPFI
jgi:hypothetical protein